MNILPLKLKFRERNSPREIVRSMSCGGDNRISCKKYHVQIIGSNTITPCYDIALKHETELAIDNISQNQRCKSDSA